MTNNSISWNKLTDEQRKNCKKIYYLYYQINMNNLNIKIIEEVKKINKNPTREELDKVYLQIESFEEYIKNVSDEDIYNNIEILEYINSIL